MNIVKLKHNLKKNEIPGFIKKGTFRYKLQSEAAIGDFLLKKVFLKISKVSQENTCFEVSF